MNSQTKRQKRTVGDVVKIDHGDGFHSYARVLDEATFAFYDCRTQDDLAVDSIVTRPILFQVPVMDYAVKRGLWKIVGSAPLEEQLRHPTPRFMQDVMKPTSFSIYEQGKIRPAIKEKCVGLERAAVWSPSHVEDRLRDHYAGRKNVWVESLKIKD